jgi:hypothetical protein
MKEDIRIEARGPLFEPGVPEAAIQAGLDRFVVEVCALLETKVKAGTPVGVFGAQGGLLSTIHGEPVGIGKPEVMGIVGHQSAYGDVIEMGRRPGTMPPAGSLVRWIQTVMLPGASDREAERIEYAVRMKIKQKGFDGAHMFQNAFDSGKDAIASIAADCGLTIAQGLGGQT